MRQGMGAGDERTRLTEGTRAFLQDWHANFGLDMDSRGRASYPLDANGNPTRRPGAMRASDVSIRDLAEAIVGTDKVENYFHPSNAFDFGDRSMVLQEAAVDPTAFLNISTFNLAISGLVNAEIMEHWKLAQRIGDKLITVKPTKMNGQKLIGTQIIGKSGVDAK